MLSNVSVILVIRDVGKKTRIKTKMSFIGMGSIAEKNKQTINKAQE